ncbi:MAG TPA: hypothetical protein VHN20_12185, partial [Beijerinckiaceae bacterium]|nr:hypothetical protein [Beijerinckiaceae bacterium]
AFGLATGAAAWAQEFPTTMLPPGCQVGPAADAHNLCQPQKAVLDFGGLAILADPNSPMRTVAWMGTFGVNGPTGLVPPGSDPDDTLVAVWQHDVTETGSISSAAPRRAPAGNR